MNTYTITYLPIPTHFEICEKCSNQNTGCQYNVVSLESAYSRYVSAVLNTVDLTDYSAVTIIAAMTTDRSSNNEFLKLEFVGTAGFRKIQTVEIKWDENKSGKFWCHHYQSSICEKLVYKFMNDNGFKANHPAKYIPLSFKEGTQVYPAAHLFKK